MRGGVAAFLLVDGVLVGGEGYEPGDRVVVVRWRGSVADVIDEASRQLDAQVGDDPPLSGVVKRSVHDGG